MVAAGPGRTNGVAPAGGWCRLTEPSPLAERPAPPVGVGKFIHGPAPRPGTTTGKLDVCPAVAGWPVAADVHGLIQPPTTDIHRDTTRLATGRLSTARSRHRSPATYRRPAANREPAGVGGVSTRRPDLATADGRSARSHEASGHRQVSVARRRKVRWNARKLGTLRPVALFSVASRRRLRLTRTGCPAPA
jgi:hypothetical protein